MQAADFNLQTQMQTPTQTQAQQQTKKQTNTRSTDLVDTASSTHHRPARLYTFQKLFVVRPTHHVYVHGRVRADADAVADVEVEFVPPDAACLVCSKGFFHPVSSSTCL